MENYADLMFTQTVQALQETQGTRENYQKSYSHRRQEALSDVDIQFIQQRDSLYIATISETGWPYIQHRGGARGFCRVISPTRLAMADYRGNRQFISQGNLATNDRISLFFMDYLNHARLKMQGHATLIDIADADPNLVTQLDTQAAPAERVLTIDIAAMDWNCPKYIPTLYPEATISQVIGPQIGALRAENEALRAALEELKSSR